jgi:DNA-3-methyladenine glycosylase
MTKRRGTDELRNLCSGPGKLTEALDITDRHHELSICTDQRRCFLAREENADVVADKRIGITRSADLPWRFTLRGSRFVSRPPKTGAVRERGLAAPLISGIPADKAQKRR